MRTYQGLTVKELTKLHDKLMSARYVNNTLARIGNVPATVATRLSMSGELFDDIQEIVSEFHSR
jgi:hypothetical protein